MKTRYLLSAVLLMLLFSVPAFSQQRYNSDVENTGTSCSVTLPGTFNTANANLPDPFLKLNGQRMTTKEEWTCRRQEILKLLERTCYGTKPPKPANVTGTVSRTSITVNVGGASFSVTVTMPSSGSAPYPLVIRYDNSGVPAANFTGNGVAVANFTTANVGGGTRTAKSGAFYTANPNNKTTGHLAAWAWGVSRIIDVIEADPNKLFDPTKIGVTGCSRDGKGAFVAGVLDQRVALTMPMESGTGGMASMRVAYNNRDTGGGTNGAQPPSSAYSEQPWLGDDFNSFTNNPNNLPIDMHEAIALVAPRGFLAVYKTASSAGQWLNVPGSHVSAVAAAEVYKALGFGGNFGWLNTGTESHCQWTTSYNNTVKDFIDIFLHRTKAPGTAPIFTENNRPATAASMKNWTTPTLSGQLPIGGGEPVGFALSTTASPAGSGTIGANPAPPASGRYAEGATVILTPNPATGWKFDSWSGDATGNQSPLTITMNANKSVTAKFTPTADCTTNSVLDGNFPGTSLTSNWALQAYGGSAGTASVAGGKVTINITTAGTNAYEPQLVQKSVLLDEGIKYRLTFDASAAAARSISVFIQKSSADYDTYAEGNFNLTTTQQSFKIEFEAKVGDPSTQLAFNVGGTGNTQSVTISNVKLICIADFQKTVTLTFDSQGGSTVTPGSIAVNSGVAIGTLPANPTRTGYTFGGWFSQTNGAGTQYTATSTLTANATAYAKWTADSYTITYNVNGGSAVQNGTYTIETQQTSLLATTKNGYNFAGWYENPDFTGNAVTVIATGSTGNKQYFAKWNIINYNIVYELDGGNNHSANPATYTIEDNVILQDPSKDDFDFVNWEEGNEIPMGSTGEKTFTAIWNSRVNISENSSVAALQIYPNPAVNGNFNVVLNSETAVLTILNLQGQVLFTAEIDKGVSSVNTNLGAGIYIVFAQMENGVITQKLIIK